MSNWYTNRDVLKDACGIPVTATGDHDQLDLSLENTARLIDEWIGYPPYAHVATGYFTPRKSDCLYLPIPFTAVNALRTDAGGDGSYESTWATAS